MTKRTKTDSLNFRISDVRKAKLISIAENRKKTLTEVMVLTRQAVSKSRDRRLIEFVGEPIVLGKDRSWLTGGKNAHKLGPRITNEVTYVSLGVCTPSA